MARSQRFRAPSITIFALVFASALVSARADDQQPPRLPSAASMIAPDITKLEDDIAQLVQKRDTVPEATLPWLELQIDSRIFSRWLLAQAASGKDAGPMQIAAYLHGTSMLAIVPVIDDFASKQTAGPNSVQAVGTGRLHQLTYQIKGAKDTAALDACCADVAQDILIAITPMRGGDRLPPLLPMRPAASATSAPAQATTGRTASRTIDDLAALARQASVSPPLRKQLIAIAALAQQAQADPAQSDEAKALRDELERALDLAAGLQANTAVTADQRGQIESQLCDGLALFGDRRMREAGRARLASLHQYRELLGRVDKMRVPPELKDALAPALAWAHENPDQGDKVLSAIEKFVALHRRSEATPAPAEKFAALRPNDPLRRAYEEVSKQLVKARGDFLADAANLGAAPARAAADAADGEAAAQDDRAAKDAGTANPATGPDALSERVNEMAHLENLLDVLTSTPRTLQTIDAFRLRPTGGVDRRVNSFLIAIESPIKSPARDEAIQQLTNLHKLASIADDLANQTFTSVPPAVAEAYAGDQIGALQTKWKSIVTDLASAFEANQPMDPAKLNRLQSVRGLMDALTPAADFEAAFAKPDGLTKWADWTLTPDQVHALVAPYQHALADAFAGFVSDNPDALAGFVRIAPRYAPIMAMLTRTGGYADACAALPEGTQGMLDRLATPYDKAPFADQRFASFVAALCTSANGDSSVTDSAAAAISDRLRR